MPRRVSSPEPLPVPGRQADGRRVAWAGGAALLTLLGALALYARTRRDGSTPGASSPVDVAAWHFAHGRLGEAERHLERARALPPDDPALAARIALQLGEIELRRGLLPGQGEHLLRAREHLLRSSGSREAPPRSHALLGEVRQRLGELEGARAALERAAETDAETGADGALLRTRLGMVRRDLGELSEARAAFEQALALDPRSAEAWCGLGLLHAQEGRAMEAETALSRATELEPDHPEARANLGRLQELRGETAAALASYRAAVAVNPDYEDGLFFLGSLLAQTGAHEEALRVLERLVARRPPPRPHVRAYLATARLRLARGEAEVPRRLLEAVLAFNADQSEARELLKQLDGQRDSSPR